MAELITRRGRILVLSLAGLALWLAVPQRVCAEHDAYQIALLDLETEGVNDRLAGELAQHLRAALSARPDYALRPTQVSLQQLSIAQDCELGSTVCLASVTRSMQLDGLLFGTLTRDRGAPVAMLRRFDLKAGVVDRTAVVAFATPDVKADELKAAAERLLHELLDADAPKAEPAPAPVPAELPAPTQTAPSEAATTIAQAPLDEALSSASSEHDSDSTVRRTIGWTLLGLAVASGAMAAVSAYEVNHAENDADFERYRSAVGHNNPSVRDVCDEADHGLSYGLSAASFRDAKQSCSNGTTFEVLQFVFLGGAVVAGSVGAFLLLSGGDDAKDERRSGLQLRPRVGRTNLGLDAAVRF